MGKNIKVLSKENILSGKIQELVPELYELQTVIENSDDSWHDNESVFDHTMMVMSALERLFLDAKRNLKRELNQKIDQNSKKILLKVAAIFHDIAKKETIVVKEDGYTSCPGHAELGKKKAEPILERFDLSEKEKQFVLDIIGGHMHFHYLLTPGYSQNFQKDLAEVKRKIKDVYAEVVLLDYADTVDGGIRKTKPKEYRERIGFYKKEIEKLS